MTLNDFKAIESDIHGQGSKWYCALGNSLSDVK